LKEQSHKQEMSAAVRADFARLRARGVTTTISQDEALDLETPVTEQTPPLEAAEATAPVKRRSFLKRFRGT
jgi:hypothetical protein